jgi:uncharacterized protein YjeT (DUF2065 family)
MGMLIKFFGIFIVAMGISILLNPKIVRKMMVFWLQGRKLYMGGLIRIILGCVLLYHASQASSPKVILALGVLALLGGLLIFILGLEKSKKFIGWWENKPEHSLRWTSLLVIAFGVLLIYSA